MTMRRAPAVYMLASRRNGTLYTGVTANLIRRVWEHKHDLGVGFTRKYVVHTLVYYEIHVSMYAAITREKQIKAGSRADKINLIETQNPCWRDLYSELL